MLEIIEFWFGANARGPWEVAPELQRRWFVKDPSFDEEIVQRFGPALEAALVQPPQPGTPQELLSALILLDQFPRNAFRGSARMFAGDPTARTMARQAVKAGWDRALRPIERMFVYLPYEHSEAVEDQVESLRLFGARASAHPDVDFSASLLDYAKRHAEIVQRFGRYPHRNELLGRPSTPEELEFLAGPGSSF